MRDELIALIQKEQKYPQAPGAFADAIINLLTGKITGEVIEGISVRAGVAVAHTDGPEEYYHALQEFIAKEINKKLGG